MQSAQTLLGGGVKAIYRGRVTLSAAQLANTSPAFTAVNMARTEVRLLGCSGGSTTPSDQQVILELTSTTQVTATRATNSGGASAIVSFEVTEFY